MEIISYAVVLADGFELSLEQWSKTIEDIKKVVKANLREAYPNYVQYEQAVFAEEVIDLLKDALSKDQDEEE